MFKRIVLVTGAPRSGTTPVGHLLGMLPKAATLYEPMGLTGDKSIKLRFPIPGESDFSLSDFSSFVTRMQKLDLSFKSQRRPSHKGMSGFAARVFGSRSLLSYYQAKLLPYRRDTLIWKDPHAIFCSLSAAKHNIKTVVSMRSPYAHAASFKRLGWVSQIDNIYSRYCSTFGEIDGFSEWHRKIGSTPIGSAVLLWHLIHKPFVSMSSDLRSSIYFHNMEKVAADEITAYSEVFNWLGEDIPKRVLSEINNRNKSGAGGIPQENKVHNFNRTAAQANSYWKDILNKEEVKIVDDLNGSLWSEICNS
jgi:hypothetical protein